MTLYRIKRFLMILSIIICICSHVYCLFIYNSQPAYIRKNVQKGIPYIFQSDEDYFAEIQKLRITDDFVYVLYGGKSIVKVYRHDGTYVGTIAVYDKRASGGTSLYTDNTKAYIEHDDCLYEFEGIQFIYCYISEKDDRKEKLKEVRETAVSAKDYSFRFGNIIKYENSPRESMFIQRDLLHRVAYPGVLIPAELSIVLLWIVIYKLRARKLSAENKKH